LVSLYIAIDTQIAGLVLCPFFIVFMLKYIKKKWLVVFPVIPLIWKFITLFNLSAEDSALVTNYISSYFSFASNMHYLLIFFIFGVIWAFYYKRLLTSLLVVPCLVLLIGVFNLQTFALRYQYFFVFALVVYASLLLSFLYEKYGKIFLIAIFFVLVLPSTLFFPLYGINVLNLGYTYYDYSAPITDYKNLNNVYYGIPYIDFENSTLISFFSSNVEWYIKKPDYVLPFSMNGIGEDQISYNSSKGIVDVYSGAPILEYGNIPEKLYYVFVDSFSVSKLKPFQTDNLNMLIEGCENIYQRPDLRIYKCE